MIRHFGVEGAALGTAVSLLLGNGLFMNWYYHRRIGLDMIAFWKSIVRFVPAVTVVSAFGILLNGMWSIDSWGMLILGIAVYSAVYGIVMAVLGFDAYEKQMAKTVINALCRRKK